MASMKAKQQPKLTATKQSISDVKVGSVPLPVSPYLSGRAFTAATCQYVRRVRSNPYHGLVARDNRS